MASSPSIASTNVGRSLAPAAERLPFEMLQQILAFGHQSLQPAEISRFVVTVSHVSRFWRSVSLQQGCLWTTLDLAWSNWHWGVWAERAGDKPLHCVLRSSVASQAEVQKRLEQYSSRISSLMLAVSREDIEDAEFVANSTHFPALTSLIINVNNGNHTNRHPYEPDPFEVISLGRNMPQLESLDVHGAYTLNISSVAHGLKHLSIDLSDWALPDWLNTLRTCVNMESLQVTWELPCSAWEWGEGPDECPIIMTSLRTLEISVDQTSVLAFLNSLRLPILETFRLEVIDRCLLWDRRIGGIEAFLASLCSLNELTITSYASFLSDFLPWLSWNPRAVSPQLLPSLKSLLLRAYGDPLRLEADQQQDYFDDVAQELMRLVKSRFQQSTTKQNHVLQPFDPLSLLDVCTPHVEWSRPP
ncbi:uncharacterized protein EI90DRAFT_3045584 [Cantharellus anzutake]|uniref:uncharacterized protein n=1 Tax=Cantharellus anzutake TaxID=1750568 RepID=UPI001907928B|nr:uncharacterized protein EI90DRAFT_3045584 [Cantharellus anzutake]KAF8336385.1 hypothetical protein EI90DRAFT_3045584 [Cantharellus anzutake]